tara:strand:- start:223 stop:408 length:186 start_codon:yes stop_codon:yes gene_type:complete
MKHYSVKIKSEFIEEDQSLTVEVEDHYEFLRWLELLRKFHTSNILNVSYDEIEDIEKNKRL